jgi:hypothetical protein
MAILLSVALAAGCAGKRVAVPPPGGGEPPLPADFTLSPLASAQAEIFGFARGFDGTPFAAKTVYLVGGAGGSETIALVTRHDGWYRSGALAAGVYTVRIEDLVEGQVIANEATVTATGATRADLSLDRFVRVAGSMRYGSDPPPLRGFRADLLPDGGEGKGATLNLDESGSYVAFVEPGRYRLAIQTGVWGLRSWDTPVIVTGTGREQVIDFAIPTVDATVQIDMPAGADAPSGYLAAEYRTFGEAAVTRIRISGATYKIPNVLEGVYEIGFIGDDGMQAYSGPVELRRGAANVIRLVPTQPRMRSFYGAFRLPKGRHQYKFYAPVDFWQDDIFNPIKENEGVFANSVVEITGQPAAGEPASSWPRVNPETGDVQFWVRMPTLRDEVFVRGTFNRWNVDSQWRMEAVPERTFQLTVPLEKGTYQYKLYSTDGVWWLDEGNPARSGDGLEINNTLTVPTPPGTAGPTYDPDRGTVTFRAPVATRTGEVYVRGSFNNWEVQEAFRMAPVP